MKYDVYLVGVGGQGILTVGEILSGVAQHANIPVNFFPSKGMAQRGGFVKAQLRLGREGVGPNIPQKSADLVISMERSEALKAIRYLKPGGDFVLFSEIWAPTAVMLGKAPYPELATIETEIHKSGARLLLIPPEALPLYHGELVAANVFMLGAAMKHTSLSTYFKPEDVDLVIQNRWKRAAESNRFAFQMGLNYQPEVSAASAA